LREGWNAKLTEVSVPETNLGAEGWSGAE